MLTIREETERFNAQSIRQADSLRIAGTPTNTELGASGLHACRHVKAAVFFWHRTELFTQFVTCRTRGSEFARQRALARKSPRYNDQGLSDRH